jgi:phosphatidylserine decarboxylase
LNFAREGYPFIGIATLLAVAAFAQALARTSLSLWRIAVFLNQQALWVAYFFRDPERSGERGSNIVVAPADGKLIMIAEVDEPAFIGGRAMRLSIFMNVFNVHVNRYPIDGTVGYLHYNKGKFLNAAAEKSSLENEQSSVGIQSGSTRVLVRQIAGLIARRIVTYSKSGQTVKQGDRMGLIRFGSRVDVFIPTDARLRVQLGTLTTAGSTVLAELPAR